MASPIALPEIFNQGMQNFVIPEYVAAPFTTIQNRAMVSASLKAIAGVERIPVAVIKTMANEFGPNGEPVQATSASSPLRFVGTGFANITTNVGFCVQATGANNQYMEFTFYGTGLNILTIVNNFARDIRVTVDGGVEGVNIFNGGAATGSNVLNSSIYNPNQIMQIVSGLSLGWHTVRIRNNSANGFQFYGFEIINERSDLAVISGKAIAQASSVALSTLTTSSFKAGIVGSRGARVVKYIQNGVVSQVVQEVDSVSKFFTTTDHSNEEVLRRVNVREFGILKSDDFSSATSTAAARTYTLDDGVTNLMSNAARVSTYGSGPEGLNLAVAAGNFWTLTFIGTGLDLYLSDNNANARTWSITIDGVLIGSGSTAVSAPVQMIRIASGLPYGTHTVRMIPTTNDSPPVVDFIIYQPKRPSVPANAFDFADYNVMADYTVLTSSIVGAVSTGVIRKFATREIAYVGTGWTFSSDTTNFNLGYNFRTTVSGDYAELTFWGTGVEWQTSLNAGSVYNVTLSIDGSSNLSTYSTALITGMTGVTLNAATGAMTGTAAGSSGHATVKISGLTLGLHKIRVSTASTAFVYMDSFDIISPIHINDPALKVGSLSVRANQNYDVMKPMSDLGPDLSRAKALILFDGANSTVKFSMNVAGAIRLGAGNYRIYFERPFKSAYYVPIAYGSIAQIDFDNFFPNYMDTFITNSAGTLADGTFALAVFGELAEE